MCCANIAVLWCVGVSYLQGGGIAMSNCGSWGVAGATDVSEHVLVVKVDICRSCDVLRHRRFLLDPVVDSSLI